MSLYKFESVKIHQKDGAKVANATLLLYFNFDLIVFNAYFFSLLLFLHKKSLLFAFFKKMGKSKDLLKNYVLFKTDKKIVDKFGVFMFYGA